MTAIEQQAIDHVQLQHQPEEPEGARPDVAVGLVVEIVYHQQLAHYLRYVIVPRARRHGVDDGKADEAHYHHLEQLEIMIAHERRHHHAPPVGGLALAIAVFHLQAVSGNRVVQHSEECLCGLFASCD